MKLIDLFEARSNPDKNTRETVLGQLAQYAGQKDVYVSFTSGFDKHNGVLVNNKAGQHKIGINPQSNYNTPIGIYTYPVDYVIEYSKSRGGNVSAPYTGMSPWKYLYVVRRISNNMLNDDSDMAEPFRKLQDLAREVYGEDAGDELVGEAISTASTRGDPRFEMWNLARLMAGKSMVTDSKPFGGNPSVGWNILMRRVGIDGYDDNQGLGLIHGNEPTQTVFFTTQAFRVIDTIAKSNSNGLTPAIMLRGIRDKNLNVAAVPPENFKYLFQNGTTIADLKWLASKMGAIQKRIVNETVSSWPEEYAFDEENLEAIRLFGPISNDVIIDKGTKVSPIDLSNWGMWLKKSPSKKEWKSIIKYTIVNNSLRELNAELIRAKGPYVDDGLIDALSETKLIDLDSFMILCRNNGITPSDTVKRTLFVNDPMEAKLAFRDMEWSFQDWYRAARINPHMSNNVGELIPLQYAIQIISRDDRSTFTPNRILIKRLLDEKSEFMETWIPRHGISIWNMDLPELKEFIDDNLVFMIETNPQMLKFFSREFKNPTPAIKASVWRDYNQTKSLRLVSIGIEDGWISQHELLKRVKAGDRVIANYVAFNHENWQIAPFPELVVTSAAVMGKVQHLPAEYLPLLIEKFPDQAINWRGNCSSSTAKEIYDNYPIMRDNPTIASKLSVDTLLEMFKAGTLNYAHLPNITKFKIIESMFGANPEQTVKLIVQEDSPFIPYPPDILYDMEDKMKPYLRNATVSDYFAHYAAKEMYVSELRELQLNVSVNFLKEYSKKQTNRLATMKIFSTPIPEPLLSEIQIAHVEHNSQFHGNYSHNIKELLNGPTPTTLAYFKEELEKEAAQKD